jgi:hypothetical protein
VKILVLQMSHFDDFPLPVMAVLPLNNTVVLLQIVENSATTPIDMLSDWMSAGAATGSLMWRLQGARAARRPASGDKFFGKARTTESRPNLTVVGRRRFFGGDDGQS